uniref:CCT domain-containing protein n=1 Tax=Aegilops tauschii subsp. strangulata TaxID=200361 RepID=A0A453FVN6_AEGTS
QLGLHSPPRLQHRRSPGDERIIAGAVRRQLRPRRRRRAVLAEGRAIQRRREEGAGGAISLETPPEELHQKNHRKYHLDSPSTPCKCTPSLATNVLPSLALVRQYACRKSLADSRPRVKGRFARNGEAEAETDDREASDNSYDYCGYSEPSNQSTGNSRYHGQQHIKDDSVCNGTAAAAFAGAGDNGDWWWRAPGAEGPRQVGFDVDEELWATLGDMLSVNLAS